MWNSDNGWKIVVREFYKIDILFNKHNFVLAYPFSVISVNNYLYILGSRKSVSEDYKSCYRFSPRTLEWFPLATLLHDRSRFGVANIDNYIYCIGGFEGFKRYENF